MTTQPTQSTDYDAIVIGAGPVGLYQLHLLRERGLSVRTLEAGSGVGGAWYWNRYPGARLDSESYTYQYFFNQELLDEWSWSEEFVTQPELERYYNFVADKLDLRPSIDFDTRVVSTVFDESTHRWTLATEDGRAYTAKYVVAATGILSVPYTPAIEGLDSFQGRMLHTAVWPHEPQSFDGRRVAVIGTGSTGIQIIQALGPVVGELTVFQRSANWATPLNNSPISAERMAELRAAYPDIRDRTQSTSQCFNIESLTEGALDVSEEERRAHFEKLWNMPGLVFLTHNFADVMINEEANDTVVAYLTEKIKQRVNDPEVARKLIPDHRFGQKRPPLEVGYYEVFNQDNVELVNLGEEAILRVTATGIQTTERHLEFDDIILATGFDALAGSFNKLGIVGSGGVALEDWWSDGPRTYLGLTVHHFPNLFMVGPQGVGGNFPASAKGPVDWITQTIADAESDGVARIEATHSAEQEWVDMINATLQITVLKDAQSWITGHNIPGKVKTNFTAYLMPMFMYKDKLASVRANGYEGFDRQASADAPS
ncbi:flavin-containing monooxygenase [Longivirga aurantiaca]|uniref:Flavin-containing monooxygenase n=1 Tax=Longivirga aurantiaca TaxID=1837743 RepID=A0ABW1T3C6_9ACTN